MKKKGIALAVCIVLAGPKIAVAETFTGIAAMNLGDINSRSYLNEHFNASIPILYTSAKEALLFSARLAPNAVFDDLGVEKLSILKSLQFKVKIRNGEPYIAIKSSKAINLPFISFVIEVYSPEGSIYQDYTVLLDPRHFTEKDASTNVKHSSNTATTVNNSALSSLNTVKTTRPKKLRVKAGDTLSRIANTVKLENISNKNMSLALFLKNPRAFSGNNPNKLKKGVTLKVPTLDQVNKLIQRKPAPVKPVKQAIKPVSSEPSVEKAVEVKTKKSIHNQGDLTTTYKVKAGDSLSAIARKFTAKSASFYDMMRIIHKANPQAFTNNKVSLLKKGVTLNIPLNGSTSKTPKVTNSSVEKAINLSLNSLEKRLREIRKALKSTKSEVFDLKLSLKNKDILLERRSKELQILKAKLLKIQDPTQATVSTKESSVLSESINQKAVNLNSAYNSVYNNASISKVITYSGLALLLGLILLRIGRQKYAEKVVASSDYVPTAKVNQPASIEEFSFTKTLTETEKATDYESTGLSALETDNLVDELVGELDIQTSSLYNNNNISTHTDNEAENAVQKSDSSLDSWIIESTPQESPTNEQSTDLKADIIKSLEKTMEKRVQVQETALNPPIQQKHEKPVALDIDLERHLQSINDQIAIDKMKELI